MPPFLWLRFLTSQTLQGLHRHHLKVHMRDANQEVSLGRTRRPRRTRLAWPRCCWAGSRRRRAGPPREMQLKLQEILNDMEPLDREVLALRHFEELANGEVAQVLGLSKIAASNRYIRALERLKEKLKGIPGFLEN